MSKRQQRRPRRKRPRKNARLCEYHIVSKDQTLSRAILISLPSNQCPSVLKSFPFAQHRPRPSIPYFGGYQLHQFLDPEQNRACAGDDGLLDGQVYPDNNGLCVGGIGEVGTKVQACVEVGGNFFPLYTGYRGGGD